MWTSTLFRKGEGRRQHLSLQDSLCLSFTIPAVHTSTVTVGGSEH